VTKKIPDALVIVFGILVLITIMTWLIPSGTFDRTSVGSRSDVVIAGSYHKTDAMPQGIWEMLQAPFKGFTEASKIIAFVLLVGGAFSLVMSTGAIDAALLSLIRTSGRSKNRKIIMLSALIFLFSLCGFTFGMSEESLVFILFTIPMARSMGYDTIVGVAIPFVSSGIGGAAAAYNPFSVGVAMEIAGLPFPSGVQERSIIWLVLTLCVIVFVVMYANRIEKNPQKSFLYNLPSIEIKERSTGPFDLKKIVVILIFLATLVVIPFGSKDWDWGVIEIGAAFLAMGLMSVAVMRFNSTKIITEFTDGAKGMLTAALVIGLSRSVLVIARDGQIIDTILFHLANSIEGLPSTLSIQLMFIVQGIINFFIPSGSGQAAITMPVMAPLADLTGISRQSAVMAFQLAAGFFDLIIPTSGVTMGVLSLAGIPYQLWLKWIWKLMLMLIVIAMVSLAILVNIDFV